MSNRKSEIEVVDYNKFYTEAYTNHYKSKVTELSITVRDPLGNTVTTGDRICYYLSTKEYRFDIDEWNVFAPKRITGIFHIRASVGVCMKVESVEVIDYEDEDDMPVQVGSYIPLKLQGNFWHKHQLIDKKL